MKICWDNLEDIRLTREGNFKNSKKSIFVYGGECKACGSGYLMFKRKPTDFCSLSCASKLKKMSKITRQKISKSLKGRKFSEIHKERLGVAISNRFKDKTNCPMYGKKHSEESKQKMSDALTGRKLSANHRKKISVMKKELFKDCTKNPMYGKKHTQTTIDKIVKVNTGKYPSKKTRQKMSKSQHGRKSTNYTGVGDTGFASYITYAHRLRIFEEVRVSMNNSNFLEVKCTNCQKWFIPSWASVRNRLAAFNGTIPGEYRLYCSDDCKESCPIYKQVKYPKGFKPTSSREVNPLVKRMCFERDNYMCQICGTTQEESTLNCHHIEGYTQNPRLGNDIDNVITLCKSCHKEVHRLPGCKLNELGCNINVN